MGGIFERCEKLFSMRGGVEMEVDPGNELCPYVLALLRKFVGPQISSSTVSEFPRR